MTLYILTAADGTLSDSGKPWCLQSRGFLQRTTKSWTSVAFQNCDVKSLMSSFVSDDMLD